MPQFYHDIVTEKSFLFLAELRKKYRFILIGGWAVFLYTRALKSKDIDIIIDYDELGKIKSDLTVYKNERLKKYEIKTGELDIDIYLPHYSDLGIDIEKIKKETTTREGFILPRLEILFMLKLYAWHNRRGSLKGQKDELDSFSLAFSPEFDWRFYLNLTGELNWENYHRNFIALLKGVREIKELGINERQISKIKKNILNQLQDIK